MINKLICKCAIFATVVTFLLSGLVINFLQLLVVVFVKRYSPRFARKLTWLLMYSSWSQIVACFDWFCKTKFRITFDDPKLDNEIFKEHSIFLANHSYALDWIGAWCVTDKLKQLASCKAMLKNELKYVPVVGWSWAMSDQIFLDRNWEKDKHKLNRSIDVLLEYEPMVATFFCEGTRFTTDKLEESIKFAKERNMIAPKYHLIPRTKGFVAVVRRLRERQCQDKNLKVYLHDVQVAYESDGALNLSDIIEGKQARGHMFFKRIPLDAVPEDDEQCAQWLRDLYVHKDSYEEYFRAHKKFPGHERREEYRPRLISLANWLFWNCIVFTLFARWMFKLYLYYGTFYVSIVFSSLFAIGYLYQNFICQQADVDKSEDAKRIR